MRHARAMIVPPAVTIHGLDDARAALAERRPVTLLSAPGAALTGGCLWWRSLIDAALGELAEAGVAEAGVAEAGVAEAGVAAIDILDCADAAGRAMAALRVGQRLLVLEPDCPAFAAVAGAAAAIGATVLPARPVSLDLGSHGARRRLKAWLAPVT